MKIFEQPRQTRNPILVQLPKSRLSELLDQFRYLRVGVLGDFALDAYWYADMQQAQLSRERPYHIKPVTREEYSLGAGANICLNLKELGIGVVYSLTVLGNDWRGKLLEGELEASAIDTQYLHRCPHWLTPLCGRVIQNAYGNQDDMLRLDFTNDNDLPPSIENKLVAALEELVSDLDALVIADYFSTSVITRRLLEYLNDESRMEDPPVFVADSRENIATFEHMILKPNRYEASAMLFPTRNPDSVSIADFRQESLRYHLDTRKRMFITLGKDGCIVVSDENCVHLPAVHISPPIDPVGAGDAYLAALTGSLASNASPVEAGALANIAAAVTVKKLFTTGTATPNEIIDLYNKCVSD